jgi:outer membrane protein assembly factor BamA
MGSLGQIGPFSGQSFDTFNAYQEQLREVRDTPMGKRTYAVYHNYKVIQPRLLGIAKIDLLGGIVRPAATLNLSKVFVERYGGSSVRGVDETGISEPTKLDEDCAAGLVTSCDGDWANTIKLSLTLDTRDFPTDPDSGALLDVSYETGKGFLGTPNFDRLTSTGSVYVSPFQWFGLDNRYTQLTFAARVIYSVITSDAPFWLKNQLSFSESTGLGLGGIFTLRGYRLNRFVGNVMAVGNLEARYDVYSFNTKRSTITFKIVPHFDAGRVFDRVADTRLSGFRYNGGGGLYLQWNQSNIIRADVGFGDEGSSFGVNFGMMY